MLLDTIASATNRIEAMIIEQGRAFMLRALLAIIAGFAAATALICLSAALVAWLAVYLSWPVAFAAVGGIWLLAALVVGLLLNRDKAAKSQQAMRSHHHGANHSARREDDTIEDDTILGMNSADLVSTAGLVKIGLAAAPLAWRFRKALPLIVGGYVVYRSLSARTMNEHHQSSKSGERQIVDEEHRLPPPVSAVANGATVDSASWHGG